MKPTNKDLIRMHLEEFIREGNGPVPVDTWASLLYYCLGYYGEITTDHIDVVEKLQREGKVR